MKNKREASQYRERLDKTLASPELTNEETIEAIVKNQLQRASQLDGCNEIVLKKRTLEVSNFLDMLRSASLNENEAPKAHDPSHPEWKIKQDNEDLRVMYREGDQGTPFHTLLAEGYVDGPVDECLCVSWESGLYMKWWPQIMIPSFRILSGTCVQKVRVGEEISLLRVKVPWPLSTREALVHYFEFEYVRDDLVVVLINTISDVESVNINTHGFSKDGIPEAKDVVRIDVVGGFVVQKVTPGRSYFRTIARMDIKLDFVPTSLINFIARQLIGNGFKLYEKIVASAFKNDDDFRKALSGPMYVRIRKVLFSSDEPNGALEQEELNSETFSLPEEHSRGSTKQDSSEDATPKENNHESESSEKCELPTPNKAFGEIEEEEGEDDAPLETCTSEDQALTDTNAEKYYVNRNEKLLLSPKVEEAIGTLDKVIFLIQKYGFNAESKTSSGITNVESKPSEDGKVYPKSEVCAEESRKEVTEKSLQEPRNSSSSRDLRSFGSNTYSRESNHNRIAPASPEQVVMNCDDTNGVALSSSTNGTSEEPILSKIVHNKMQVYGDANGSEKNGAKSRSRMKQSLCCFGYNFG